MIEELQGRSGWVLGFIIFVRMVIERVSVCWLILLIGCFCLHLLIKLTDIIMEVLEYRLK